nr:vegetative cell wall protein gp1-like [Penaeus vannamei]
MSDFDHFTSMSSNSAVDSSQKPEAPGSNRDSLNLDDFEKVEADQLPPAAQGFQAAAGLMDDLVSQATSAAPDSSTFGGGLDSSPAFDTGLLSSAAPPFASDPFKTSDPFAKDPSDAFASFAMSAEPLSGKVEAPSAKAPAATQADTGPSSARHLPSPPSWTTSPRRRRRRPSPSRPCSAALTTSWPLRPPSSWPPRARVPGDPTSRPWPPLTPSAPSLLRWRPWPSPSWPPKASPRAPKREPSPEPLAKEAPFDPLAKGEAELFGLKAADPFAAPKDPSPEPFARREPSPTPSPGGSPPRRVNPLLTQGAHPNPGTHPPPKEPTPPPREPTPPPKVPTPTPREPTPPPREPTPPPREPTPPPREPTPPPKVPTPTPREPTPPPREPTPPPREPTPPPKVPTPTPREPTPPPREPTPPPKVPTPTPKEPTPPREVTPPPQLVTVEASAPPVQEARVTAGRKYEVSAATRANFAVFNPRAWFNPDQLDPRVVDLIYWRDVKKTGVVFGGVMMILISLAYLSLISVVAYTSLTVLSGTITFRIYKNIMQAVQKSQDGHPFKDILELDTNLPSEKVHEATDVIIQQINSTISELKRLFLVEDLVDSVKFGCLLWCLTYLGSWFNGLTLVILAVVALFSLPKVYEQNQAQID